MASHAPTLLNDDGSASMATALMMIHHGLRRDLALFAIALRQVAGGDRSRAPALHEEWRNYRDVLQGHHEAEDQRLFPHLRGHEPALIGVIEGLAIEHRRIDPLLEQGDEAFARLPATEEPAALVTALSALLDPHLATEEAKVVPFLREARGFPPPGTPEEIELFAQGFAWSAHGIAPDVLEPVFAMLPEAVRSKLPAARTAFEERCRRVWGTTPAGASRTPIPDWLTPA